MKAEFRYKHSIAVSFINSNNTNTYSYACKYEMEPGELVVVTTVDKYTDKCGMEICKVERYFADKTYQYKLKPIAGRIEDENIVEQYKLIQEYNNEE